MGIGYEEILAIWRDADRIPLFEHAWLWDHMVPLRGDVRGAALEAWTLLAALAAQTTAVAARGDRDRQPAALPTLLAKMAATVDIISGGRLIFGVGVGGSLTRTLDPAVARHRAPAEFDAYGVELVPTPEAIAALGEALTITRRLWTETEPFDFEGRLLPPPRGDRRTQAGAAAGAARAHRRRRRTTVAAGGRGARRHLELPGDGA